MENNYYQNEDLRFIVSSAMAEISIHESYWNMVAISEIVGEHAKKVPYNTALIISDGAYGIKVSFLWMPKKPFGQHNGPDCTEVINMYFKDKSKTVWCNDKSTRKVLTDDYVQVQNIINNTINEYLNKLRNSKDKHMYSEEWLSGRESHTRIRSRKKK